MPIWMLIAQGVKKIADNQNGQSNTQNSQSNNSANNAFSTFSSVYNNYLNGNAEDKKKNLFGQLFNRF